VPTTSALPDDRDPELEQLQDQSELPDELDDEVEPDARPHSSDPLAGLERVEASLRSQSPPGSGGRGRRRDGDDRRGGDRRTIDIPLLLASLGIAIGLVVVVLGLRASVTGREQQGLPDAIESIDPIKGATQVPQQTRVFVDLQIGYGASLDIDGVPLDVYSLDGDVDQKPPGLGEGGGDQVVIPPGAILEPGNNTLTFTPGPSQPIEAFSTGLHTVTLRYWRTEDGPDRFRTFTWTFYAV
jgi:hypothetical protein